MKRNRCQKTRIKGITWNDVINAVSITQPQNIEERFSKTQSILCPNWAQVLKKLSLRTDT